MESKANATRKIKKKLHASKVYVRIRPMVYDGSGHDQNGTAVAKSLESYSDSSITLGTQYMFSKGKNVYEFPTKVLDPDASQEDVYETIIPRLLDFVESSDVLLLAYGQTGTGKTTTMFGFASSLTETANQRTINPDWGIIPRITYDLFNRFQSTGREFRIAVSSIEFYLISVVDLLSQNAEEAEANVGFDIDNKPAGYTRVLLSEPSDILKIIQTIMSRRASRSTSMNVGDGEHAGSSRSHCSIIFTVLQKDDSGDRITETTFTLLDLAGAERPSKVEDKSETSGEYATWKLMRGEAVDASTEGLIINFTLFEFGKQVKLATGIHKAGKAFQAPRQACHPMTKHLSRCIDGRAYMSMIICLSQAPQCGWETWFSLNYGTDLASLRAPVAKSKWVNFNKTLKVLSARAKKTQRESDDYCEKHDGNTSSNIARWMHMKRIEAAESNQLLLLYNSF